MILYCVLWNNIAFYNFILPNIILYCALGNNIASYDFILSNIIRRKQIFLVGRNIRPYCAIWDQKTQYYIRRRNMRSYSAIWNHRTQYNFLRRNIKLQYEYELLEAILSNKTQYYSQDAIQSYCATWNYKTQYCFTRRNIRLYCVISIIGRNVKSLGAILVYKTQYKVVLHNIEL